MVLAVCQHCKLKGKIEPFKAISWNGGVCSLIIKCWKRVTKWRTNWFFYFSLKNIDFSVWKLCHLSLVRKRSVPSCNFVKSNLKAPGSQTTDSLVTQQSLQPHILKRFCRGRRRALGVGWRHLGKAGNHVSGICTSMSSDKPLGAFLFLSHSKHGYPTHVHSRKWCFQVCRDGCPWRRRGTHGNAVNSSHSLLLMENNMVQFYWKTIRNLHPGKVRMLPSVCLH